MKIAQINTVCGNGSVGRITVDIYHALKKSGHDGKIFYGRRTAQMKILPFDFEESCRYFNNLSDEDKALIYGIVKRFTKGKRDEN